LSSTGLYGGPLESEMQPVVEGLGAQIEVLTVNTVGEIDNAFAALAQKQTEGLFVAPGPFLTDRRVQIATLATRHAVPTIFGNRDPVEGADELRASETDILPQIGFYIGRFLSRKRSRLTCRC
jgi:putative tryptophan/tyrosine transport system substrate-binding protein